MKHKRVWKRISPGVWKQFQNGRVYSVVIGPSYHGQKDWVLYFGSTAVRTTHPTLRAAKEVTDARVKNRD